MGKSHYRSHIIGKDGTQNIASVLNITALGTLTAVNTALTGDMSLTGEVTLTGDIDVSAEVSAAHVKIGTSKYIFATTKTTAATLEAEATAYAKASLDATLITGSIALGVGALWYFTNSSTATKVAAI